ncbi:MAG TPA: hypothetical protein VGO34_10680 [Alphaproteobacteria bacterium]|jgi:hypothetical protein
MTDLPDDQPNSQPTAASADGTGLWRLAGLSPEAVAAANAAARRAHVPMATWLASLIHAVADHEEAAREAPGEFTED